MLTESASSSQRSERVAKRKAMPATIVATTATTIQRGGPPAAPSASGPVARAGAAATAFTAAR